MTVLSILDYTAPYSVTDTYFFALFLIHWLRINGLRSLTKDLYHEKEAEKE